VLLGKFDPVELLRVVAERRITHAMLVPVQHERILRCEALTESDVSSLRFLFSTSAPLRAETKRELLDRFDAELIEIYGTTEGGVVTSLPARQFPHKLATVGRPGADCEIKILDESGRELDQGRAGEVVGRAANMMCGYLNRPSATEETLWRAPDGRVFIRSGDVGRVDEDGFLHLLDRLKDVIISGGFNVYATDLEAVLLRHPDVLEAAVIGIPSDRWGETPLALVVPKPDKRPKEGDLLTYCNELVGKNQRLSGVELRTELPKNAIGKILKKDLRHPYWSHES
jgi:acyl-CoA synthetase (AMP-forming)/AMP-acid ligase II